MGAIIFKLLDMAMILPPPQRMGNSYPRSRVSRCRTPPRWRACCSRRKWWSPSRRRTTSTSTAACRTWAAWAAWAC